MVGPLIVMKDKTILTIVVILIALAAVSLWIGQKWPADGLWVNLTAGFIGNIVTLLLVDRLLSKHESARWNTSDALLSRQLKIYVNLSIASFRGMLGISMEQVGVGKFLEHKDRLSVHIVNDWIKPRASEKIEQGNLLLWEEMGKRISTAQEKAGELMTMYAGRISPEQLQALIRIMDKSRLSLMWLESLADNDSPSMIPMTPKNREEMLKSRALAIAELKPEFLHLVDALIELFQAAPELS